MGDHDSVRIFSEGHLVQGTLTWGWQCFDCREEATGFGSATTAQEGADNHVGLGCPTPPVRGTEEGL